MITMTRLLPAASIVIGSLLLSSCYQDPYAPPGRPYGDNGPYNEPYPQPPGTQGSYGNPDGPPQQPDPYGNPPPQYGQQGIQDPNYGGTQPPVSPPPVSEPRPTYPTAQKTKNPNEVISPYPPYNVIDVTGFKSGQKAKDPSNKKIFVVP